MSNKEFIMSLCNCGENNAINYKPYEAGRLVKSISVDEAAAIIEQNTKELQEIGLLTDDQCVEGARNIFKKHLVIFEGGRK